jgi:acid phosphatase family membrane protein YuiD
MRKSSSAMSENAALGGSVVGSSVLGQNQSLSYALTCRGDDESKQSLLCKGLKFAVALQVIIYFLFALALVYFIVIFIKSVGLRRIGDWARSLSSPQLK